ncbi:MAG: Gfo/Idh/MocA family protein, partial [Microbacterium gubbeenense]
MTDTLRVAMIGYGFMGAAHSQAWRTAPRVFDLPKKIEMSVIVGRSADAVAEAADKWGWREAATDWREVIARDDIDVVDIVTPGHSHDEIAIAALAAGKHVLCEKPLANSVADADR